MEKSVFDFKDYKTYLKEILSISGQSRGKRAALSRHLNCESAFVSQVLNGTAHFNLEHVIKISEFLRHTEEETAYFLCLGQLARAGSALLQKFFLKQLQAIQEKRQVIRERIGVKKTISEQEQLTYYSAWYHSAIHILLAIPRYRTKTAIADHLKLPLQVVSDSLDFLVSINLAKQDKDRFLIGDRRIHLGRESSLLSKHHINWRLRAMNALDDERESHLHYSSVMALSNDDAEKIKAVFLGAIEKTEPILRETKEESVFCIGLDIFAV